MNQISDHEFMHNVRYRLGFTQTRMAEYLGYGNKKDISRIERGHRQMSPQVRAHLATIEKYVLRSANSLKTT